MPIEKLILKNFQKHKRLVLDLDRHLTVLTGKSDSGKSSIVRGLTWLATNRPSGDAFIRLGKTEASVEAVVDSRTIKRSKGKGVNSYELDDQEFKAFGSDVPEPIAKLLNVDPELNFVGQFDPPFWLSKTGGEVSKELNRVVNLSLIDSTLGNLAAWLKKARTTSEVITERLNQARNDSEALAWVDKAKTDLDACNDVLGRLQGVQKAKARLESLLSRIKELEAVEKAPVPDLSGLAAKAIEIREVQAQRQRLDDKLEQLKEAEDELCRISEESASVSKDLAKIKTCPTCGQPSP